MSGKLTVVVGGQYGSEGKGAISGYLAAQALKEGTPFMGVRVAGPNAGHTVYGVGPQGEENYEWRLRSVPVNAVTNPKSICVIAAGSEIDMEVLLSEIFDLNAAGYNISERLVIDQSATMLTQEHHATELGRNMQAQFGSTSKGIGAARAARLMRSADLFGGDVDTAKMLRDHLAVGGDVVIEGTQGYGLGLHAGEYPFCTSQDCRAIDFLGQAGLSPWDPAVLDFSVIVVARTYPIRVAGNSGPLKNETSWSELGLPEEFTTVTRKVRRVGQYDHKLVRDAVAANGGAPVVQLALTMFDQVFTDLYGQAGPLELSQEQSDFIDEIEEGANAPVAFIGTSPTTIGWRA
ncbi:adenylosuccinate synthetase [uncultured Caudovirales phage]|uniref:N6-succino-2-amino-2'-deoxyadenylate synthase n=1 Tax=uncultured Caudovirales phage TaxID=2100421 RepID=A0A6J5SYB7_9CAUD|nr:adenylosuccinate synthetase [uncultured Caudovirales phage]CAB4219651.1 adenylosuccinate synthetase [uncultured Caudovirales phage]